jgi:hypothetical protein
VLNVSQTISLISLEDVPLRLNVEPTNGALTETV